MKFLNICFIVLFSIMVVDAEASTTSNDTESNALAIAKKFNQLFWNFENVEAAAELLSDDFSVEEPSNGFVLSPMKPTDAVKKRTYLNGMIPNLNYKIDDVVVSGNTVVLFINADFTHSKVIKLKAGIAAPSGQKVEYKAVFKYQIDNGKITKMWMLVDAFTRDIQLGLHPKLLD